MGSKSFGEKMGDWFRNVLSCCDDEEEEEQQKVLQISAPTNFRREDISFPNMDAHTQQWVRDKAAADAKRMYAHLQPLRSSPSGHFSERTAALPSFEQFTTPRPAPSPTSPTPNPSSGSRRMSMGRAPGAFERVRAHTRKISNSLTGSSGVGKGYAAVGEEGNPYEMSALVRSGAGDRIGKVSGESQLSRSVEDGSEVGERDSAKGGLNKF